MSFELLSSDLRLMAPPPKPPAPSVSSQRIKAQSSGLPKIDIHKKSNSFEDLQVDDILRIMKNPLDNGSENGSSGVPTPLSGIITPRVESFSGNSHTARYQGNFGKSALLLGPQGLPIKDSPASSHFDFSQQRLAETENHKRFLEAQVRAEWVFLLPRLHPEPHLLD